MNNTAFRINTDIQPLTTFFNVTTRVKNEDTKVSSTYSASLGYDGHMIVENQSSTTGKDSWYESLMARAIAISLAVDYVKERSVSKGFIEKGAEELEKHDSLTLTIERPERWSVQEWKKLKNHYKSMEKSFREDVICDSFFIESLKVLSKLKIGEIITNSIGVSIRVNTAISGLVEINECHEVTQKDIEELDRKQRFFDSLGLSNNPSHEDIALRNKVFKMVSPFLFSIEKDPLAESGFREFFETSSTGTVGQNIKEHVGKAYEKHPSVLNMQVNLNVEMSPELKAFSELLASYIQQQECDFSGFTQSRTKSVGDTSTLVWVVKV